MELFFGAVAWGAFLLVIAKTREDTKRSILFWSWVLMLVATLGSLLF